MLANPNGLLKPNMLATVTLRAPESHALLVPADALVDTGTQQLVFIADGTGRFTPREVRVGRRSAGQVELLSGVADGDEVAASATFFLDSESQLRGALQKYEPLPNALPMPMLLPCMSQLEAGGPPSFSLGEGPVQPFTNTKPTPASTSRRASSRFCPNGCIP